MSKQPSVNPLTNPEVVAAAAQRAATTVSRATVDIVNMQDLARATVNWVSRLATRKQRPCAQRSTTQVNTESEGRLAHYYRGAREFGTYAYNDVELSVAEMYEEVKQDVTDMSPLPPNFDYAYAMNSYSWLFLIMTAKTLGHRLARVGFIYTLLEAVFSRWVAAILLYVLLPTYTILINQKISERSLTRIERYFVIIVLAFFYGLFGEFIWLHWVHFNISAPYYYYPAIIGFMLQVAGPQFGNDRRALLGTCIGAAISVSLAIAAYRQILTIYYIGATIVSAMSSLLNLQLLIGDLRKHGADGRTMICGHYRAVIIATYSHALVTLICARYSKDSINYVNTAVE